MPDSAAFNVPTTVPTGLRIKVLAEPPVDWVSTDSVVVPVGNVSGLLIDWPTASVLALVLVAPGPLGPAAPLVALARQKPSTYAAPLPFGTIFSVCVPATRLPNGWLTPNAGDMSLFCDVPPLKLTVATGVVPLSRYTFALPPFWLRPKKYVAVP